MSTDLMLYEELRASSTQMNIHSLVNRFFHFSKNCVASFLGA
jgi:hypothetical protein